MSEQDITFLKQIVHSQDKLKNLVQSVVKRIAHLESHLEHDEPDILTGTRETPHHHGLRFNATFNNSIPMKKRDAYLKQFQHEPESVFRDYHVSEFEGVYNRTK